MSQPAGGGRRACYNRLLEARKEPGALTRKQQSELMIAIAPHVEDFIGELFGIAAEVRALQAKHDALAPLYALKRKFVQKKAISGMTAEKAALIHGGALAAELESLFGEPLTEQSFVEHVSRWLEDEAEHARAIANRAAIRRVGGAFSRRTAQTSARCFV